MPAFNTAAFVGETVQSVLAQEWSDFELLLVDDGSTDATREIATRLARQDDRIRVLTQPNRGVSAARNVALAATEAPLIALLDSDDLWTPAYLATTVRLLDERPDIAVVTTNAWNLGGPRDGTSYWPGRAGVRPLSLAAILDQEASVCILSLFRREVVERIGGFDEALRGNEDYDFWIRAAHAGFQVVQLMKPLAFYRRRTGSASGQALRMTAGIVAVFERARHLCRDQAALCAIIDAQIARFRQEALGMEAKEALRSGDFARAADCFAQAYREANVFERMVWAGGSRYAPRTLQRLHRWGGAVRRRLVRAPALSTKHLRRPPAAA